MTKSIDFYKGFDPAFFGVIKKSMLSGMGLHQKEQKGRRAYQRKLAKQRYSIIIDTLG